MTGAERVYDMLIVHGKAGGISSVALFNAITASIIGTRLDSTLIQETAGEFNGDGLDD